jgi:hydrogenase-4 membrane subunit HyfE
MSLLNLVLSLVLLCVGIYILYKIYKKPSLDPGTNTSGVIGGLGLVYLGFMGVINKINIIELIKDIFN